MIYNNIDLKISILENILNVELENSTKLLESLNVLNENNIEIVNEGILQTIGAKIKNLWEKFKKWLAGIVEKFKEFFGKEKLNAKKAANKKKCDEIKEGLNKDKDISSKVESNEQLESDLKSAVERSSEDNWEELQKTKQQFYENRIRRSHEAREEINKSLENIKRNLEDNPFREVETENSEKFRNIMKNLNDLDESTRIFTEEEHTVIKYGEMASSSDFRKFIYGKYNFKAAKYHPRTIIRYIHEVAKFLESGVANDFSRPDSFASSISHIKSAIDEISKVENYLPIIEIEQEKLSTKNAFDRSYIDKVEDTYNRTLDLLADVKDVLVELKIALDGVKMVENAGNYSTDREKLSNEKTKADIARTFAEVNSMCILNLTTIIKSYTDIKEELVKELQILSTNVNIIHKYIGTLETPD